MLLNINDQQTQCYRGNQSKIPEARPIARHPEF